MMNDELMLALQITALGMGLVFGVILLYWLLMALLVRATQARVRADAAEAQAQHDEHERKQRAAVAAVVAALAQHERAPREFVIPPTARVSPWQAAMRANQLRQRGRRR